MGDNSGGNRCFGDIIGVGDGGGEMVVVLVMLVFILFM